MVIVTERHKNECGIKRKMDGGGGSMQGGILVSTAVVVAV